MAGISNRGSLTLINSIIANSKNGSDCENQSGYGTTTFQGKNMIGDGSCNATLSGNPKLGPLLDNGGATLTQALRNGSPAVNIANTLCASGDQRHISRPQPTGGVCDLGAYEKISTVPPQFVSLVQFFDAQVAAGGLLGVGSQASFKPDAVRNQLLAAFNFKASNATPQACSQLAKTLTYLDADNTPAKNDYLTGNQVAALAAQIKTLQTQWGCP